MKNQYKNLMLFAITSSLLISCSSDDDGGIISPKAFLNLSSNSISVFDTAEELEIDLVTDDGVAIQSIEVLKGTTKVADATISGDKAMFNTSTLLPFTFGEDMDEETGSFDLTFRYNISNGINASIDQSLSVNKAISLTNEVENVRFLDETTSATIEYETSTFNAIVSSVTANWKIGSKGTHTDTGKVFNTETGSIVLKDQEYLTYGAKLGDTLFYQFIATSATGIKDIVETSLIFIPIPIGESKTIQLSNVDASRGLNLMSAIVQSSIDTNTEVTLTPSIQLMPTENTQIQFAFIAAADAESYFAMNNLTFIQEEFNNNASTPTTGVLKKDDIYIYKIDRVLNNEDDDTTTDIMETSFGIIKIGDIIITNNELVELSLEYRESKVI